MPSEHVSLALQTAAPSQQRLVVVSVSPQSRASLAARFQLTPTDTAKKLTAFFKKIGRHQTSWERSSSAWGRSHDGAPRASESLNSKHTRTFQVDFRPEFWFDT